MNNLKMLFNNEELFAGGKDWALLILRVIPSFYLFCLHGMDKVTAGTETWDWLGGQFCPYLEFLLDMYCLDFLQR